MFSFANSVIVLKFDFEIHLDIHILSTYISG